MTDITPLTDSFEAKMAKLAADKAKEINKLETQYGARTLENIDMDNGYVRRHLAEIADDFAEAKDNNLVFKCSLGKELTLYLTPDEVIERFEQDLPFSNTMHQDGMYDLISPETAISEITEYLAQPILSEEQISKQRFNSDLNSVGIRADEKERQTEILNTLADYAAQKPVEQYTERLMHS